jgi:hypothetical protein
MAKKYSIVFSENAKGPKNKRKLKKKTGGLDEKEARTGDGPSDETSAAC